MARRAPGSWKAQAEKKICSEKGTPRHRVPGVLEGAECY